MEDDDDEREGDGDGDGGSRKAGGRCHSLPLLWAVTALEAWCSLCHLILELSSEVVIITLIYK